MNENKKELTSGVSPICPKCKTVYELELNFCVECGTKVVEVCNCWVRNVRLNCKQKKCPGIKLHEILSSMAK